ncbi:MAG: PrsA2, partial [uncultured bacterium]
MSVLRAIMIILSGSSNPDLATKIAEKLKKRIYFPCTQFADGEIRVQIPVSLRKQNVYIIQSTSPDTNKHILELFLMADAVKRASGKEVTLVIPYFGYSRQDRKDQPRVPISSALISRLLKVSGADRIVTVDIHSDQQQGFFDGPWDNLYASYVLLPAIKQLKIPDLVIVSPDKGGTMRANAYAKRIQAEGIAVVYKERDVHLRNISKALDVIGDVEGKNCIIVDDIIDT